MKIDVRKRIYFALNATCCRQDRKMPARIMVKFLFMVCLVFAAACACSKTTDETLSSEYGFATISGTTWKTRVRMAISSLANKEVCILLPDGFDPAHPKYRGFAKQIIAILPEGTALRIEKLTKNATIEHEYLHVTATILDGDHAGEAYYIDEAIFKPNKIFGGGPSRKWEMEPEYLTPAALR